MQNKSKLIAKNTLFMYARMLVMLVVSLFTARIVYNTLGVENYGTYHLVAGVIVFFSFINNALSTATQRFITAQIAQGNEEKIRDTFNIAMVAHLIVAATVLILAQTLGLWIVNNVLNIPPEQIKGAQWAYQFAVIIAVLGIVQSPFGSLMVAYEKLNIYALFSIVDVVLKLAVIYAIQVLPGNKLIVYSALLLGVSVFNMIIYRTYSYLKMPVCRFKRVRDKVALKEMFSFTGWSLFGQVAVAGSNQGVNVLINLFFNVTLNAAMGISNTITSTVNGFVRNFQVAFNPQIIKSFNNGEHQYLQNLLIRSSKLSSYLVLIFLVPLVFEMPNVLTLWLGTYPPYTVELCILSLLCIYLDSIAAPFWMLVYAQSNIKKYQIIISSVYSLCFFGALFMLYIGAEPYSVIGVRAAIFVCLLIVRVYFTKHFFPQFNIKNWLYQVVFKGVMIILFSALVTGAASQIVKLSVFPHIAVVTIISLACTLPLIYLVGMNKGEQKFIKETAGKILSFTKLTA